MKFVKKKHSFWWSNSPPDFVFQPQLPKYADIVIVGAGFAGISTAYWLISIAKKKKKKAIRIVVLDEAPYAACKSSGRMNGSVYLGSNKSVKSVVNLLGKKTAKQLFSYSNKNNLLLESLIERGVECDGQFNGGLRLASTAKELKELDVSAKILKDWGYFPARFSNTQSQHLLTAPNAKGSLYVPGEGIIDPFAFTNRLARILRKEGIWIVYGTRVDQVTVSKDYGPELLLSNGHALSAGNIVHTTPNVVACSRITESLIFRREHVIRTEAFSDDLDDLPLPFMPIEFNGGKDSVRVYDKSVIMTGGKTGLRKDPEIGIKNDTGCNDRILKHLDDTMMSHVPITNFAQVTHSWTYIEQETHDGLPLMGEIPDAGGQFVNFAHGRNKFGLAFLGAKSIAQKILHARMSDPEFNIFSPKRLMRGE